MASTAFRYQVAMKGPAGPQLLDPLEGQLGKIMYRRWKRCIIQPRIEARSQAVDHLLCIMLALLEEITCVDGQWLRLEDAGKDLRLLTCIVHRVVRMRMR